MQIINTIDEICQLAQDGFTDWARLGHVDVKRKKHLLLFNYTHAAQLAGRWNSLERLSRGLIIDGRTGVVAARPFDKFFNWNEGGRSTDAALRSVTEKLDGVLGVLYRDSTGYSIASRGAFDSPQAQWATNFLRQDHDLEGLPDEWTLLFEIINPNQRLVVDYGDACALTLLAIRDRFTGEYLPFQRVQLVARQYGFPVPKTYTFDNVDQILEAKHSLDGTQEGWVAEFADGQRFKFKGDRYLEIHKLAAGVSFKKAVNAVATNTVDAVRESVPEEFLDEFDGWIDEISRVVGLTEQDVARAFRNAPHLSSRREFAVWAKENHPKLAAYLFTQLDGKAIKEMICQREFNRPSQPTVEQGSQPGDGECE